LSFHRTYTASNNALWLKSSLATWDYYKELRKMQKIILWDCWSFIWYRFKVMSHSLVSTSITTRTWQCLLNPQAFEDKCSCEKFKCLYSYLLNQLIVSIYLSMHKCKWYMYVASLCLPFASIFKSQPVACTDIVSPHYQTDLQGTYHSCYSYGREQNKVTVMQI